jgi:glutamine synthetase
MNSSSRGMLTRDELAKAVTGGEIETVIVAFPDMYGRLIGKRYDAGFFLESGGHGMHFCNYLLADDIEMDTVPGYRYTSWEQGYGDATALPDWSTLRRASWLDRTALVLCDVVEEHEHNPVSIAPRTILRDQLGRLDAADFSAMGASELEFFAFKETYETAAEKHFHDLKTFGSYIEDYHIFQGMKIEGLLGEIRRHLNHSGIPVEFSKGEWGPGQEEINIRYSDVLAAADRGILFKQITKEIAFKQDIAVTFMAKWHPQLAGNSQHIHLSLWDATGEHNVFAGDGPPNMGLPTAASDTFKYFLGGLLAHAREMALFYAPTVNSYKRYQAGSFAPTGIAWSYDNRTAGFRIVGTGSSLRIECRIPGADANPYLAFAAMLASGLDGIENRIEPPAIFEGDVYAASNLEHMPRTLYEAIDVFEGSDFVRKAFGDDVAEHYLHFARTEQRKFNEAVTNWELKRFFEQA